LVPAGVHALIQDGNSVWVQRGAGEGSGFSNEDYTSAGAKIVESDVEVYERSETIVKVKEPIPQEYHFFTSARSSSAICTWLLFPS
jgi:alanine dehydrogenase